MYFRPKMLKNFETKQVDVSLDAAVTIIAVSDSIFFFSKVLIQNISGKIILD